MFINFKRDQSWNWKNNQKEEKNVYLFQGEGGQKAQNKMSEVKCVGDIKKMLEVYFH